MKYNQYDIEDFLVDPDFLLWVKEDDPETNFFFQEWINSNPKSEKNALLARELLLGLKNSKLEPTQEEYKKTLTGILSFHLKHPEEKKPDTKNNQFDFKSFHFWKAASVILILLVSTWYFFKVQEKIFSQVEEKLTYITRQTTRGTKLSLKLPDGSIVKLNSDSKITFPARFSRNRIIKLEGEAFFDVVKNKNFPFVVNTEKIKVKVLGTSFNVKSFPDEEMVEVAVLSGKVMASTKMGTSINFNEVLSPNEVISFQKSSGQYQKEFVKDLKIYWKDNLLVFNNADFYDVIKEVERWYGYDFIFPNGKFQDVPGKINGTFYDKSLDEIIKGLEFSLKIKAEINHQNKKVIINKKENVNYE
ncbi:MAG: FecR family protein [Flammeovirgaceae bacterium]|nr:FecR family protein [Flammeovirgaceae bacterium]